MNRAETVGFGSERGAVLLALMLSTGLIAIDSTILATAVPSVVRELGQFDQFPWLFSVYLLAQAVSVPIYSKLADTRGRKPIIIVGVGLFLVGSVLAGISWNMGSLIGFRVVQGLGAGAISPMSMTIVGDLYTVAERAVVQGYIASVWAIASVLGPALGGVFSQFASWRWIFWVNIPLCLIAGWTLVRDYHEVVEPRSHRLDLPGAIVLTVGLTALIGGMLEGGNAWSWWSWPSLACFVIGGGALIGFGFLEARATEPVLDLSILRRPLIVATTVISIGVGALTTGITSYVPTYLENSIGAAPLLAGLAVAALTLGWPLAASQAGRFYLRQGYRSTILTGCGIAVVGATALAGTANRPNAFLVAACCFVIGFGLGWTAAPSLIAAQASAPWHERAVVTGVNMFARSAGSAVGVAVYGAIANNLMAAGAGEHDPATVVTASTWVFVAVAVTSALTWLAALRMPPGPVNGPAYTAVE